MRSKKSLEIQVGVGGCISIISFIYFLIVYPSMTTANAAVVIFVCAILALFAAVIALPAIGLLDSGEYKIEMEDC